MRKKCAERKKKQNLLIYVETEKKNRNKIEKRSRKVVVKKVNIQNEENVQTEGREMIDFR